MYKNEISFSTGEESHRAFLQAGFYTLTSSFPYLHSHNYTEIHVIRGDGFTFTAGGERHTIEGSALVAIPRGMPHNLYDANVGSHTAFQVSLDIGELQVVKINTGLIEEFFSAIKAANEDQNHLAISSFISLFCAYISKSSAPASPISDHGFIIKEFFSLRYPDDVHLSDLAKELCTSPRHAERLVIKYTGHSFLDELTKTRTDVASQLMRQSDMPLSEIASYVGYRSYSGFWKAMRKMHCIT